MRLEKTGDKSRGSSEDSAISWRQGVHRSEITWRFLYTVFVASFGSGFQNGYNIAVLNTPRNEISLWISGSLFPNSEPKDVDHHVTLVYSVAVSIYCIGGLIGALSTSVTMEYMGLKWAIVATNIFVFIGAFFMGFARWFDTYVFLIIGRFVVGLNAGVGAGLITIYMTAISPISVRGAIGSCYQLFLTFAVLIGEVVGMDFILGNQHWPYLFSITAVVGFFQTLLILPCADSPEYLYERGKIEEARQALVWLRGTDDVDDELDSIARRKMAADAEGKVSFRNMFTVAEFRKPLIISCMVILSKQCTGINGIIPYSTSVFNAAGLENLSQYGSIALAITNVILTVVSMFIVDLVGRKVLLTISFGAMASTTLLFFGSFMLAVKAQMVWASYACILILVTFVVFYASGAGPIPWFIVSELFISQKARAKATSLAIAVHWISYFIVGLTFPLFQRWIGPFVFIIYFVLQVTFLIYIIVRVPETKGKTVEEINAQFKTE